MGWLRDFTDAIGFTEPDRSDEVVQSTVTSSGTEIPEYLETFSKEQLELIDTLSKTPYKPPSLTGDAAIAGFTTEQQAAMDAAKDYYGKEGGTEAYQAASGALSNLSALADQRITDDGALTPFMNQYLDPMREEIDRAYQKSQMEADAQAMGPGGYSAFGSNRRGIVEGELRGDAIRQKADLQRQAFDRAVTNYQKDAALRGQAASSAMTGAGALQSLVGKDLGGQFMFGGYQQAMDQAKIDQQLAEERDKRDYGFKMADFRQGGLTNIPYGSTVTNTADVYGSPGGTSFMTGLGNVGGVIGGIGEFFATPSSGNTPGGSPASGWSNFMKNFS
jgi:hypothetical protein